MMPNRDITDYYILRRQCMFNVWSVTNQAFFERNIMTVHTHWKSMIFDEVERFTKALVLMNGQFSFRLNELQ